MTSLDFELASARDSAGILAVLEKSSAKGPARIIYTRRPDAYASYQREAPDARIFVWRNGRRVVGVVASLTRDYHIGNQVMKGTYIGGLKKDPDERTRLDLASAFETVADTGADFVYCSVVAANLSIVRAFETGQRVPASVRALGGMTTMLLKSGGHGCVQPGRVFRRAEESDEPQLSEFYDRLAGTAGLFPVGIPWQRNTGLDLGHFYVVTTHEGQVVAAGALWDQTDYRQYIVDTYSPPLQLARALNRAASSLGYPNLPRPKTVVAMPMACFLLAEPGEEEPLVAGLIRQSKSLGYAQVIAGHAHASPFHAVLSTRRCISYDSVIYQVLPTSSPTPPTAIEGIAGIQCAYL